MAVQPFSGVRLGDFCYRIARYVINSFGVEFFGTSGTVVEVGVKRLFAYWGSKSVTKNLTSGLIEGGHLTKTGNDSFVLSLPIPDGDS